VTLLFCARTVFYAAERVMYARPIAGMHFVDLCICRFVYLNALLSLAD